MCYLSVENHLIFAFLVFPGGCRQYFSPVPISCLNEVWLDEVGCSEKGAAYPGNSEVYDSVWRTKNLGSVVSLVYWPGIHF